MTNKVNFVCAKKYNCLNQRYKLFKLKINELHF